MAPDVPLSSPYSLEPTAMSSSPSPFASPIGRRGHDAARLRIGGIEPELAGRRISTGPSPAERCRPRDTRGRSRRSPPDDDLELVVAVESPRATARIQRRPCSTIESRFARPPMRKRIAGRHLAACSTGKPVPHRTRPARWPRSSPSMVDERRSRESSVPIEITDRRRSPSNDEADIVGTHVAGGVAPGAQPRLLAGSAASSPRRHADLDREARYHAGVPSSPLMT